MEHFTRFKVEVNTIFLLFGFPIPPPKGAIDAMKN